jgi:hypothetical protein
VACALEAHGGDELLQDGFRSIALGRQLSTAAPPLTAYVEHLKRQGIELLDTAPIFRTPGAERGPNGGRRWLPQPYSKNNLGKDFRPVRASFDKDDARQIQGMRRSGCGRHGWRCNTERYVEQDGEHVDGVDASSEDVHAG